VVFVPAVTDGQARAIAWLGLLNGAVRSAKKKTPAFEDEDEVFRAFP
jgi:hypothetical protein